MTFDDFTLALATLSHAKRHLRTQRGHLASRMARNEAITLLVQSQFKLITENDQYYLQSSWYWDVNERSE